MFHEFIYLLESRLKVYYHQIFFQKYKSNNDFFTLVHEINLTQYISMKQMNNQQYSKNVGKIKIYYRQTKKTKITQQLLPPFKRIKKRRWQFD